MVRRGSTVRVRQRALQKRRSRGFSVQKNLRTTQRAVGMEPIMELSRSRGVRFVAYGGNLGGLARCIAPRVGAENSVRADRGAELLCV